jgi:hypothetical protein
VKNLFFILLFLVSTIANSETFKQPDIQYWEGLVYDFSNATAYEINQPIINNFEIGVIAITSQLYWDCNGCYTIIPQNYAAKLSRLFNINDALKIKVGTNYWTNKSIIFPDQYNFELGLNYSYKDRSSIQIKHYSNPNDIHNLYQFSFEHRF